MLLNTSSLNNTDINGLVVESVYLSRPISDISNSGWNPSTGSDLFAVLDEETVDDGDYIFTTLTGSVCEVKLSAMDLIGSNHTLKYRYELPPTSATINLQVDLVEGSTVKATWNHTGIGTSFVLATQVLTGGQISSLTDYTDLRVRFTSY